jgi:hypothetical protein
MFPLLTQLTIRGVERIGTGCLSGWPRHIVGVGVGDGGGDVGDGEGVAVIVDGMNVGDGVRVGL